MARLIDYIEVLKLDNFLQVLTFEERLQTSQYRAGRTEEVPQIVLLLNDWIIENNWQPPTFWVSPERQIMWFDADKKIRPLHQHELYKANIIFK